MHHSVEIQNPHSSVLHARDLPSTGGVVILERLVSKKPQKTKMRAISKSSYSSRIIEPRPTQLSSIWKFSLRAVYRAILRAVLWAVYWTIPEPLIEQEHHQTSNHRTGELNRAIGFFDWCNYGEGCCSIWWRVYRVIMIGSVRRGEELDLLEWGKFGLLQALMEDFWGKKKKRREKWGKNVKEKKEKGERGVDFSIG